MRVLLILDRDAPLRGASAAGSLLGCQILTRFPDLWFHFLADEIAWPPKGRPPLASRPSPLRRRLDSEDACLPQPPASGYLRVAVLTSEIEANHYMGLWERFLRETDSVLTPPSFLPGAGLIQGL